VEKKSLIIGAFTNYNYNQLKPWVESINRVKFSGDKVIIAIKSNQETMKSLQDAGFIVIDVQQSTPLPVHVERFIHIHEFLERHWTEYEYAITTDVRDVYFQYDPVIWLRNNLGYHSIVSGSESMRYKDEPWGNQNLMETYGPYVYDKFKNNEIFNVGTLGGRPEYIKDLCLNIALSAINRPIPIVDQAVFNQLIATQPYKEAFLGAKQCDGWACQAGTTVDPSKINQFRPHLLEAEPIYQNGMVLTGQDGLVYKKGTQFCIVHQYDRVPQWKADAYKKFGVQ